MHALSLLLLAAAAPCLAAPAPTPQDTADFLDVTVPADPAEALELLQRLGEATFEQAKAEIDDSEGLTKRAGGCTLSKLKIRREWGSLSKTERKSYISAVKCLQSKPARTPSSESPGAKTRFDDFVSVHINQTMEIHYTGNFLSWHRYYTWIYERALQEECGYEGTQPYWNWGLTAITGLEKSPIFDGSDTSLSGNGAFIANQGNIVIGQGDLPPLLLPAGTGGGCVTSGPFKDMSVNLGPANLDTPDGVVMNPEGPFAYSPRCLKRDLTTKINQKYANASAILLNVVQPQDINDFQLQMQGKPGSGNIGIHGGGHYSIGGDPGRDFFTSPGDPAFYLHHSMIDRVWWMWQILNPSKRTKGTTAIAGTRTFMNQPPSADATIDDIIDLGYTGGAPLKIRDLLSTTEGPFCYMYL